MKLDIINNYNPLNEQEKKDKELIQQFIMFNKDAFFRTNLTAHFTTSAIILNEDKTKMLMAYHLIYKSWAWLGGHNDGDRDFAAVAIKEAQEESSLKNLKFMDDKPLMLDVIKVDNHYKKGEYVSDHLHLNLTYFFIADEFEETKIKEDENSDIKWIEISELLNYISEERMIPIYKKAIQIVKNYKLNK